MAVPTLRINSVVLSITCARKRPSGEAVYYRDFRKNIKPTQTTGEHSSFFFHHPLPLLGILSSAIILLTVAHYHPLRRLSSTTPCESTSLDSTINANHLLLSSLCLLWILSMETKGAVSQGEVRSRASEPLSPKFLLWGHFIICVYSSLGLVICHQTMGMW